MPRTVRRAIWLTLACASLVLVGAAAVSRAEGSEPCSTSAPRVCLSVAATPQNVSPSREGSPTYVSYSALASNEAVSTVTHAALAATLPVGSRFVSATPNAGSCAAVTGSVSCQLGAIAGGSSVGVEIVVEAPAVQGTAVATFTLSFDEGFNDGPAADPKQDTVTVSETVGVAATPDSAASFVPQGASVELSTDPSATGIATAGDAEVADAAITSAPTSLSASLEEVSGPLRCPKGVVCRNGDWVHATIPGSFDPPLAFGLRWDKTLIPSGLTEKKFALLLTECLSDCPLEIVSDPCSSPTPAQSELPCLLNVARLKDGDWIATLLNSHNGYMH